MKLNYKIIWVEDKIETKPFESIISNIKQFLTDRFFDVEIQTAEDFEDFKVKFNANGSFDLVITDYSLNDSHGNQVIDFIRMDKHILTEVFFYSANTQLRTVGLANSSRISFYTLEGTGYHAELQRKIEELIALTIAKFEHIVSMRGLIMHETSSLDEQMIEIVKQTIKNGKIDFSELANSIYDELIALFKGKKELVEECKTKSNFNKLSKDTFVFSAKYKIQTLSQITKALELVDFSADYEAEINSIRNKFAHAVLLTDENGREYFKHGESGLEFNEELCRKIRRDIIKHKLNLDNVKKEINK
jgi:hypothetical protein